ncbi:MAG TPA: tetraacyldisaccharide 4'-kinase [Syntrophobacteraceae bacterium]|nr:tetraacyldisaccharide 4'-kinase [Syntrophobacteraceae bacterium]
MFRTWGAKTVRMLGAWVSSRWYEEAPCAFPPTEWALRAAAGVYRAGLSFHQGILRRRARSLPVPVVSVGNLVAGGTGKTPFTLWLALFLKDLGWSPAILSRGYGRRGGDTCRVQLGGNPDLWTRQYGDEPVLLARRAPEVPVWVGKDRRQSGQAAMGRGADVLILDDGFQHLALQRHLDFVLMDAERPWGNGRLLPWGPLREPIEHLERADALVLTRARKTADPGSPTPSPGFPLPPRPVFSCRYRLAGFRTGFSGGLLSPESLRGEGVIAFSGIARPDSFFDSLRAVGIHPLRCLPYADHHPYREAESRAILENARKLCASFLVTTEKDWVRLPRELGQVVLAAVLEIDFGSDLPRIRAFLRNRLPPPTG